MQCRCAMYLRRLGSALVGLIWLYCQLGMYLLWMLPVSHADFSSSGYAPRGKWSGLNSSPGDSIRIFQDIKAKRGLAMHWG